MPYLLFSKKRQNLNCRLLQIIGGALWVSLPICVLFSSTVSTANLTWILIPVLLVVILIGAVAMFIYHQKKHGRYNVGYIFYLVGVTERTAIQ